MKRITLAVSILAVVLLAGCGMFNSNSKQAQPFNDAPTKGQPDLTAARIYAMPDGFNNVAIKCIPGTHSGIATLYHANANYGGVVIFQNAEICP
jgi:hypothetical protein